MSALFRVICGACNWRGLTRKPAPGPKQRCPECRSANLKMEPASK